MSIVGAIAVVSAVLSGDYFKAKRQCAEDSARYSAGARDCRAGESVLTL